MKQKKDARYLNVNIDKSIYDELDAFCTHTGVSKTAAAEQGLRLYLDEFYIRSPKLKDKIQAELDGGMCKHER